MDMALSDLSELRVTSTSKREEGLGQTPTMVSVLTRDDLDLLGFSTTEQVMEYVTGMSAVNGEGNVFTTHTVMGNTQVNYNTNTLLLVDGKSLISPYHGSFDFAAVPVSSIARIEVIKGSHSVLYGTNGINAVINIITKRHGERSQNEVLTGVGSAGQKQVSLAYVPDSKAMGVFLDVVQTGGEELTLKDESGSTLEFNPNKHVLSGVVQYQYDCIEWHVQLYQRTQNNHRTKGFSDRQENQERGMLLAMGCDYEVKEGHRFHVSLDYYDWKLNKDFYPFASADNYRWEYQAYRRNVEIEYEIDQSVYGITLGVSHSETNARRFKEDRDSFDIGASNDVTRDTAAYFNGYYYLTDTLDFHYGSRHYQSVFHDAVQAERVELDNTSFRFALVQQLKAKQYLKLIYGEAFRVPTYFEKQVSSATVVGNANLKPEESQSISLVYSYSGTRLSWDAAVFRNQLNERITRVPTDSDPSVFQNANVGEAEFIGAESNVKFRLESTLTGFLGLAYAETEDIEEYFPWMISGAVGYDLSVGHRIKSSFKYLDEWGEASEYLFINPGYEYQATNEVAVKLDIYNLLDQTRELPEIARRNEDVPTIPVPHERSLFLSIVVNF